LEHAASLLRQHTNFLKMHDDDPFIKSYMEDIGHLEFGALHKPIAFANFNSKEGSPNELDYWLDYWSAAYEMVSEKVDRLHLVTLERLGTHPKDVMNGLCELIDIEPEGMERISKQFRQIKDRVEDDLCDPKKLARATDIYYSLLKFQI
jgi:hypothetical protein